MQDKENKAEISPEETKKNISERIQNEFRKHESSLDWTRIVASKIYTEWFEFFQNENEELKQANEQLKTYLEDNRLHAERAIAELTLQKSKEERLSELESNIEWILDQMTVEENKSVSVPSDFSERLYYKLTNK